MALRASVDCGDGAALYVRAPSCVALRTGCCEVVPRLKSVNGVTSRAGSSNIISSGGAELVLAGLEVLCPRMLEKRRIVSLEARLRLAESRAMPDALAVNGAPDRLDEKHRFGPVYSSMNVEAGGSGRFEHHASTRGAPSCGSGCQNVGRSTGDLAASARDHISSMFATKGVKRICRPSRRPSRWRFYKAAWSSS